MDRRTFLVLVSGIVSSRALANQVGKKSSSVKAHTVSLPASQDKIQLEQQVKSSQIEPWKTIEAVQDHLFPAGKNSPGIHDINALSYLQTMIQQEDVSEYKRQQIKGGEKWLNDLCVQLYHKKFIALNKEKREKVLRRIDQSEAGRQWLSWLMSYLMQALLADPVYGGNPDGVGWKWLQHQPGFPRPPKSKRYYDIGYNRHREERIRRVKAS